MGECGLCSEFAAAASLEWWELAWCRDVLLLPTPGTSPGSLREFCKPGVAPGKLSSNQDQARSCSPSTKARPRVSSLARGIAHSWHSQPSWDTCPGTGNQCRPWLLPRLHVPRPLCAFLLCQGKELTDPGCGDREPAPLRGLHWSWTRAGEGFVADVNWNTVRVQEGLFWRTAGYQCGCISLSPASGQRSPGPVPCLVVH